MNKFLIISLAFISFGLKAQTTEADPYGSEYNFDSTTFEETPAEAPAVVEKKSPLGFKPYEKFTPPMDTNSNLITYIGVMPFTPLENDVYDGGTIDSLYWRAKKFLMQKYTTVYKEDPKKPIPFPKEMLIEDYKPDGDVGRIIIKPTVPFMLKNNEFSYSQNGTITFRIDIRVKDDKYKYKISHFVHNTVAKGSEKPIQTYLEYYANQKRGAKSNDAYLLAVDKLVKDFIKELSKVMKDPVVKDEDDF